MSRSQQQKQKDFREKLQAKGADAFADGPRPWEQWDESGNQGNNRVWEGSSRRIYTKQHAKRSIGDRLLSGLAVVSLATLMVGIAGVYLSTTSTPQLAKSAIQPAPIVTDRQATTEVKPAVDTTASLARLDTLSPPSAGSTTTRSIPIGPDRQATTEAEPAADPTASQASLDTLSPPAAGSTTTRSIPIGPDRQATTEAEPAADPTASQASLDTLSPPAAGSTTTRSIPIGPDRQATTEAEPAADPTASQASLDTLSPPTAGSSATPGPDKAILELALQPAPAAPTARIDRVAVETVITEAAVTTNVYTQQPSQDLPELVATIMTTQPPFTSGGAAEKQNLDATSAQQYANTDTIEQAAEAVMITAAAVAKTEPVAEEPPAMQMTTAVVDEQASPAVKTETSAAPSETALDKAAATEIPTNIAMNSSPATVEAAPGIDGEVETTTEKPLLPDAKTGKWVINISSYTRKSTAERMLAEFKQKGIDAEIFTTTINDKPMHRIRVAGFQSSRSAKAGIPAIEQVLGLDDIWISRR